MKKLFVFIPFLLMWVVASGQVLRQPVSAIYQPGYILINEFNGGYGLGETSPDYSKYFFGLTSTHGYQFNIPGSRSGSVSAGAGAGVLFYNGGPLFPLYGDLRLRFTRRKVSPYIFGRGGLLLNISDLKGESRLFANAGGGVYINVKDYLSVSIGPGLLIQKGKDIPKDSFVSLNAGIIIKPHKRGTGFIYSVRR